MHKKTYAAQDKTQDHQNKRAKYVHSHAHTTYNHSRQKVENNAMVQQESEASITLFIKKSEAATKIKSEAKINNIYKELDDLILTGSVISAIYGMKDTPVNAWNIGLESNKYGSGLAKINCIYFLY